jgi:hypothetical protein
MYFKLFIIFIIIFSRSVFSQTSDELKQQLEESIQQKYQASASGLVEYAVYKKAYLKWLEYKRTGVEVAMIIDGPVTNNPLRDESVFIIVDFTKIRTEERIFLFDVSNNPRLLKSTFVTHGKKSGVDFARYFSNVNTTNKSSKDFYATSHTYPSQIVGFALKLHGQDSGINDRIYSRGIVFHKTYTENGATLSAGCLAVPFTVYRDWIANIKGQTMIYVHTSESGNNAEISDEDAEFSRNLVDSPARMSNVPADQYSPSFDSIKSFQDIGDSPSMGSLTGNNGVDLLGESGIPFGLASGSESRDSQLPPEEEDITVNKEGVAAFHGESQFEKCQHLANEKWDKVVEKCKSGEDPHDSFRSSWGDLYTTVQETEDIEEWRAANMADNHLAMTRECAATCYLTEDSILDDEKVNRTQTEKSTDGVLECEYKSVESQDFKKCHSTIVEYDAILRKEKEMEERQAAEFKAQGEAKINTLAAGSNIQQESINTQKDLIGEKSNIATARENFQLKKASYLQSALSQFPTRNSLLQKCRGKYKKFDKGGTKEYLDFVKIFDRKITTIPVLPDPCYNAIDRMKVKFVQNVKARNQMKKIIKAAGLKAMDFNEKNGIFKNQGVFLDTSVSLKSKSYFFNANNNEFESCENSDSRCSKGKTKAINSGVNLLFKGSGKGGLGASKRNGILDKWTNTGVYDKERYKVMDLVLNSPTDKNLVKMNNNVIEFSNYYKYRKNQGELDEYQKSSVKDYLKKIKTGKMIITDQKAVMAKLSDKNSSFDNDKIEGLIYKKDGRLFEFDIEKNSDHSLFKIISHRYTQKILELEK